MPSNSPEASFANVVGGSNDPTTFSSSAEMPNPERISSPIFEDKDSVSYLGVRLEKSKVSSNFVPDRDKYQDYISDKFALELQQKIAVSFLQGDPILIEGGTSIGKTTTVRKMCAELGWEVHYANLNGATDVEDLMGRYIPNPNKTHPEDPEYIFADGKVTSGLRQEDGKTKVIILDEFNASAPNILIRLHEVIDALERGGEVVLSEDASEVINVSHESTKVIALMNPPGKGYFGREPLDPAQLRRWVYQKEVSELPESTFAFSTESLFGVGSQTEQPEEESYFQANNQTLSREQMAEIPGIKEILAIYQQFHQDAKKLVQQRTVAADPPQPFTFDDRMEPHRVSSFVARFYNGDISETFQRALRYYYANKLESAEDRQKIEEMINHVVYVPPVESARRTLAEQEQTTEPKKTDPRAKVDEEIAGIMDSADIPDSVKEALKSTPTVELSPDILKQLEQAKEIMGSDFLGPDEIINAFGTAVEIEEVPAIPFSRAELEQAKELGQMLILRQPLTMQQIGEALGDKVKDEGKVFYDTDWYKEEKFFTEELAQAGWALVSKEVVPDSTDKNFLDQTDLMVDYLKNQVFKGVELPAVYQEAIDEYLAKRTDIATTMSSDWQKAAEMLASLQITELTRQSPSEALYDLVAYFQNNDERMLPDKYSWTKRRRSGGGFVWVGGFGSDGVRVGRLRPDTSSSNLGVSFSRSQ